MTKALTSMLGIIFSFFSRNFPRKLKINKGLRISDLLSLASSQVSVFSPRSIHTRNSQAWSDAGFAVHVKMSSAKLNRSITSCTSVNINQFRLKRIVHGFNMLPWATTDSPFGQKLLEAKNPISVDFLVASIMILYDPGASRRLWNEKPS